MEIRNYQPSDYNVLKKWFKDWDDWVLIEEDAMIPSASFMVVKDNTPIAFSTYYPNESTIAQMGFTIGDKFVDPSIRQEAVDMVLNHIFKDCEKRKLRYLYYSTDAASKFFVDKFVDKGAVIADNNDAYIVVKSFNDKNKIKFFTCD